MTERLSINADLFADMRSQFDTVLNSLVQLTESDDESEITLKLKLLKEYKDEGGPELTEYLKASWTITRAIKAKKYKVEGRIIDDYVLQTDETGKVYVQKAQIDFDEWLENEINKKEEESTYENL